MTKKQTVILGIETSCDETSVALINADFRILSEVTACQEMIHQKWGGIVPELASRSHLDALLPVLQEAFARASKTYQDLSAVAVTTEPGLIGSLIVGVATAKAIAHSLKIPLIKINHLQAHLAAVNIEYRDQLQYPLLGLIVSGGHTSIVEIDSKWKTPKTIGSTRDDAAGEAFDKAARLFGFSYPGGPEISIRAEKGDPSAFRFPRALPQKDHFDFSFSGVKTSLLYKLNDLKHGNPNKKLDERTIANLCASYQEAIVDALVRKVELATKKKHYKGFVLAGGVAANKRLRAKIKSTLEPQVPTFIPDFRYCTDNGSMIAALGLIRWQQKSYETGKAIHTIQATSTQPRKRQS